VTTNFFTDYKIGCVYVYQPHLSKYDALNNSEVNMAVIILTGLQKKNIVYIL